MRMDDEDWISNLPDGILWHILSFLPTLYSERTRILSTRWQNDLFINYVNSVFSSYSVSCMHKFRLDLENRGKQPLEHFPIESWLLHAIRHCVKQVHFDIDSALLFPVPLDLYSCKTLTDLRLSGGYEKPLYVKIPSSVCLPCLRNCSLQSICFDDESARGLFRSCSSLHRLEMVACRVEQGCQLLDISSQTLEDLWICEPRNSYQIRLNVPNLVKFEYFMENKFLGLESLKLLVDARIQDVSRDLTHINHALELIRAICHVRKLYLSCELMEAFLSLGQQFPTFNNLTSLTFTYITCTEFMSLLSFLDNSPRLEYLSFEPVEEEESFGDPEGYWLQAHVPACVAQCLKEVEFRNFFLQDYGCQLIKYFLKHAKNLKKMRIESESICNEQFEISSTGCQIIWNVVV